MLSSSSKSVSCSCMAPKIVWKAETKLLNMMARHCFRSVLLKPPACITRICFRTVDLPLSPAPTSDPISSRGRIAHVYDNLYLAVAASPLSPAVFYPDEESSRSPHSSSRPGPPASFQNTLFLGPCITWVVYAKSVGL